ncbi:MAG: response regulator transcription factor, partial [Clostridia bacterium]|nr:response regulator transcription factor [Clostridia bacterium]
MFNLLVVDDDKNIRYLIKELFEAEHFTVKTATDGKDALDILDKEKFDLAIVDIMMPNVDGYAFTEQLRSFDKELPVLMLSAKQLADDRKKGFMSGIDDYMTKPADTEELILHVKALLRRAKIVGERRIVVGNVVLNYDSFTVSKNGETQQLPQKEFLLLCKLLSFPDKIFTKIQLMDEIWGYDTDSG